MTNPFERGIELRKTLIKYGKVLCVDFAATLQKQDITKDLIQGVDTGKYAYRAKINVRALDSEIRKQRGLPPFDFSDKEAILRELNKDDGFDIPLWFLRKAGDDISNITKYDLALFPQIKACNFHDGTSKGGCLFCFVDDDSNNGKPENGVYLSVENIVNTFEKYRKERGIVTIRTSGGEPTLVLDHILGLYREMSNRGIPILAQFDSNLSTAGLIEYFEEHGIFPQHVLEKIAEYDPKVLVGFKGTDNKSLAESVMADLTVEEQIRGLTKFVKAGIDVYPYLYNANPETLVDFIDQMQEKFDNILPKIHLARLNIYPIVNKRIEGIKTIEEYRNMLDENYEKSKEIMDNLMRERVGVGYKQIERPGIELRLK